jgi:hypothetical protein
MLLDKEITAEELKSFIGLLAGAQQGQGEEVSSALLRENIKRVKLGLLNYTIFSTVQTISTQLAQTSEDKAIWGQLILHPVAAGTFSLSPDKIKQLTNICEDIEELKKLLLQIDTDMAKRQEGVSITQRGILLGNFIQNLGDTLEGVAPEEKNQFTRQVGAVLDSLEPQLKTQILGAVAPEITKDKGNGIIHEIFQAMPDSQLVYLLVDALKEAGANSRCFNNLFNRALAKHKEPGLLLTFIRQEMHRTTQEGESEALSHWQHLEQLLIQQQETDELNKQYQKEIDALATSIQMQVPMVEEEEIGRLLKTLSPEPLRAAKAQLIVNLISQPHTTQTSTFLPSLVESLGEILDHFFTQKHFVTVGNLLREVFLALNDYPEESSVRKTMTSLFNTEDIQKLLKNLLKQCRTYDPKETTAIDSICQLYPEKAGGFLLDILVDLKDDNSPQAQWLSTTLASLGPGLNKILIRRLQGDAPDHVLPRLLTLATISADRDLSATVGQLLDHRSHEIRLKVISTLGKVRAERVVPRLAEIVLQKSWVKTKKMKSLQMAAAHALADIGTDEAREVLQQVVSQRSGDLQTLCQELV